MNHTELIDKLVRELSYRVGIVNLYDKEHQSIISEILTEWGEFKDLNFDKVSVFDGRNILKNSNKIYQIGK